MTYTRGGIFSSNIFEGNRKGFYGVGQDPSTAPPPVRPSVGMMVGWGAVVLTAIGLFWGVARMQGRGVAANRRRSSRRRATGRRTTRRGMRRNVTRSGRPARRTTRRGRVRRNRRTLTTREKESRESARKGRDWARGVEMYTLGMGSPPKGTRHAVREGYLDARKSHSYGTELYNPYSGRLHSNRRRVSANRSRYKALSAAARRRMPDSSFALSGRRFPIKGPPGSSRKRDRWQAMQAIGYLNMGRVRSKADYLAIRNAVIREYGAPFWRKFGGPSWAKIEKAKRSRSATRRRRTSRRKVAANRR